tara:strand:+ start:138 stop:1919 length:1782 start_codon:yes stop_codon:yes gene_type:complete
MKLLIDNIKRTIIFKENKAFYKNKKEEVDITLFFKKSKDGISVLRKKYSHMLVSEDDRNILFGGGGTDLLKIELKKNDKEDTSKLFRKIIALYLMAEMYTNKDILDRRIDNIAATEKDRIKEIADVINVTPLVPQGVFTTIEAFITGYNGLQPAINNDKINELTGAIKTAIDKDKGFNKDTHTTNENKEITKWVQVKYLLKDFKEYIETNTTTIDTIFTLLTRDGTQRNLVGGAKLSSLTPSLLLKGNVGVAAPAAPAAPAPAGRRNGKLLIQSTGIGVNGVGAAGVNPVAVAAGAGAGAGAAGAAVEDQIKEYKDICNIFKECYEYINYLKSLYSAYDTFTKVDNKFNRTRSFGYLYPELNFGTFTGLRKQIPVAEQDKTTKKATKKAAKMLDNLDVEPNIENALTIKKTIEKIKDHIESHFEKFQNDFIRKHTSIPNIPNNILYYMALIAKEYKKILGYHQGTYTKDMTSDLKPEEITEALRKINVIENIITEYFKLLIYDKKTAIFTTAYFANVYTTKKTLIPKNYINSTMLDDIYLEKLVNIDNYSNNILDSSKFKSILQKAAAKISTVFHFSKKLTEWTNTYTEPKKP